MPEALIIVDFQNDFCPGGALAVPEGDAIAGRINELAASDRYALVVATRDWHPPDHSSFADQGGPWPVHCVQETAGADFHPALDQSTVDAVISKGTAVEGMGYSGFESTNLADLLRDHDVDRVTVVGLATDYCVKNTALDALREGLRVDIDPNAMRAVNLNSGDEQRAIEEMRSAGASG